MQRFCASYNCRERHPLTISRFGAARQRAVAEQRQECSNKFKMNIMNNKNIGLYDIIDEKSLSPESKVFIKTLDEKLAGLIDSYLTDSDGLRSLKKDFNEKLLRIKASNERGFGEENRINSLINEKASELASLQHNKNGSVSIEVKAADVISTTGSITSQPNPYLPAPTMLPGVNPIVHPKSRILDFIHTVTITSPIVLTVNETAGEGDYNWTAEGTLKPMLNFGFETQEVRAKKLAAHAKLTREMLTDIPFIQSETSRIMRDKYDRKLSGAVYSGDGSGDNIFGITHFAPAYTQTCLNGKIENPGLSEVLFAAATQIRNIGFDGALVAFVNPCDWAAEMTRKDTIGRLLEMNKLLEGITVVPTPETVSGQFLIGDLSVYTLYMYEAFNMMYGYENDDFTKNLVSLVAEGRVFGFMSDNKKGALVHDSVPSVLSLIAKPINTETE